LPCGYRFPLVPPRRAMARKKSTQRKRYTKQQRAKIIATADKEDLTATDVQKRFGVIPVTYYAWRKKAKASRGLARGVRGATSKRSLRLAVRSQLEKQLPKIVDQEVNRLLKSMLGTS